MEMSTGGCCYMSQSIEGPSPIHSTARAEVHSALQNGHTLKVLKSKYLSLSTFRMVSLSHFNISHLSWRFWLRTHYTCAEFSCIWNRRDLLKSLSTKATFFYVCLISRVTGYALDDRISIPDMDRVSFFTVPLLDWPWGPSRHQSTKYWRPVLRNNVAQAWSWSLFRIVSRLRMPKASSAHPL
jgi:hypothetical protein